MASCNEERRCLKHVMVQLYCVCLSAGMSTIAQAARSSVGLPRSLLLALTSARLGPRAETSLMSKMWEFPKIRGTVFWGP